MKELVEKIIKCDFEELSNIELPYDERIGLEVLWDGIKYEFLINFKTGIDKLLIVGSGALPLNSDFDRTRPLFDRWSWGFDESTIFYNDPTLYLSSDIFGGWGLGSMDNWYLEKISIILQIIYKNKFLNENVIFYGSSLAGFMSLMLATMIKGSTAIAEIPQLDLINWDYHWYRLKRNLFDDLPDDIIREKYNYKIDLLEFIKINDYIPNAYLILDCSCEHDFNKVYSPFFDRLNELPFSNEKNNIKIKITGKNMGHEILTQKELKLLLKNINLIKNNYDE